MISVVTVTLCKPTLLHIFFFLSLILPSFPRQPQMVQAKLLKADLHGAIVTGILIVLFSLQKNLKFSRLSRISDAAF